MSRNGAWSDEATKVLLSIWGEKTIQNQLRKMKHNRRVYEKITKELNRLGFNFTLKQCKIKIKNLTQQYRKVSDCSM